MDNDLLSEKMMKNNQWQIWTDGACSGNPGPGGWACIIKNDDFEEEYSGGSLQTTNNIMELTAAIEALKKLPPKSEAIVFSDSKYVIDGITKWLFAWKKKNWRKSDGKAVLNQQLWQLLDNEVQKNTIKWIWVKGHDQNEYNERCDQLAKAAIKTL